MSPYFASDRGAFIKYRLYLCIVNAATESPCSPHASFISTISALGIRAACSLLICVLLIPLHLCP
jgi:hypothetical protein